MVLPPEKKDTKKRSNETIDGAQVIPIPPPGWDRCQAYLAQKRRFCRQQTPTGCSFCAVHQHLSVDGIDENTCSSVMRRKRRRIPCPVDPTHSIFEDMLDKHVPVCPKTTMMKAQESQPYFKHNLNAGGHGDLRTLPHTEEMTKERAKEVAVRVMKVHHRLFYGRNVDNVQDLELCHVVNALPVVDLSGPEIKAGLSHVISEHKIKTGGLRHLQQQASLLGHLRRVGVIPPLPTSQGSLVNCDRPLCVVELGAGRGITGFLVAGTAAGSKTKTKLILVERGGPRSKADKFSRRLPSTASGDYPFDFHSIDWDRIHCDIAHVDMSKVVLEHKAILNSDPPEKSPPVQLVAIAKHLCGVGTDLALKALTPLRNQLSACLFATCCHGACSWSGYVGRDYLRREMELDGTFSFGEAEFELMRKWSAGTVNRAKKDNSGVPDDETDNHRLEDYNLEACDANRKEWDTNITKLVDALELKCGPCGLGRACQRLIDFGRKEYMKRELFGDEDEARTSVEMVHYVSDSVTPQNAVLIAYREPA